MPCGAGGLAFVPLLWHTQLFACWLLKPPLRALAPGDLKAPCALQCLAPTAGCLHACSVPLARPVTPVSCMSSRCRASCSFCAGSGVGRIVQAASGDAAAGSQDGVLSFQEGRDTLHVSFGAAQVRPAPALCRALMLGLCVTLCRPPGVCCNHWRLCCHMGYKAGQRSRRQKELHVGHCTCEDRTDPSAACLPS